MTQVLDCPLVLLLFSEAICLFLFSINETLLMHQSIPSINIPCPPGNLQGFAKDPNLAGQNLYKPKFPSGRAFAQKSVPYLTIVLISLFDDFVGDS